MKSIRALVALMLPALASCGGAHASLPAVPTDTLSTSASAVPGQAIDEAQSDAGQTRLPDRVAASTDLLYVGNSGNDSITVYHHDAQGNTAPLYVIAGPKTQITDPHQLAQDAAGNLYVANGTGGVLVFAHGANGNVAPLGVLGGSATRIHYATAVTVDQTTGKIFVADGTQYGEAGTLLRFAPNSRGNVAPFAGGSIGFWAAELASDSSGTDIIDAHEPECCSSPTAAVDVFPKQFPNGGTLAPVHEISTFVTDGVADDPTTKTYLVSHNDGIMRFAENTSGSGPDNYGDLPGTYAPALVSKIGGSSAQGCGQLALGYLRNIYAVCGNAINVYTHDASGPVAPLRVLSGAATQLNTPVGIYEGR